MTYAEAIEAARVEREDVSSQINELSQRRKALTARILALEEAVRAPKRSVALPGDVVLDVSPADVSMKAMQK